MCHRLNSSWDKILYTSIIIVRICPSCLSHCYLSSVVSPGEGDEQDSQPAHSHRQSVQEDAVDPRHVGHDAQPQFTHTGPDGVEGDQRDGGDALRQPGAPSQVLQEHLRGEVTCRRTRRYRWGGSTGGRLRDVCFLGSFFEKFVKTGKQEMKTGSMSQVWFKSTKLLIY